VVSVLEVSTRLDGPYFTMPYFDQGNLARLIRPGQPLPTDQVLDIARQIANGLQFAHQRGITHRDLKPANILLGSNGTLCLADFGLARTFFNDTIVDVERQQCEGTAPYMSPAVAAGAAEDTRCDIYSFGAVLYEMLTGSPPYSGVGGKEILRQIAAHPPVPITALNPQADQRLVVVAEAAMARELRDRYAAMSDVVEDLRRIADGTAPTGPHGPARLAGPRPATSRRILLSIVVSACLIGLGLLAWKLWPPRKTSDASPIQSSAPAPRAFGFITLAGQAGASGHTDGSAASARFHSPTGIAVDRSGLVYVCDTGNNTIRKIIPNGQVSTLAGRAGMFGRGDGMAYAARLGFPFGIATDTSGSLFVADSANNAIRKIAPTGPVVTVVGRTGASGSVDGTWDAARFNFPAGVAVDDMGNIYVADSGNHTIRKIMPAGTVATLAGQPGSSGSVDGPGGSARFKSPFGVAVDRAGFVYVADTDNHTIRRITPDGAVSTLAGRAGTSGSADGAGSNALFSRPQGLAVDAVGDIFVADTDNHSVRKVTPSGQVTTLAQVPGHAQTADGVGVNARFSSPTGIAVDAAGNLYVVDAKDHTIRKGIPIQ
jgi:sugar lactone lactonase YvrE